MIRAGIDEAGYGPTLGPLAATVTAFACPDQPVPPWEAILQAPGRGGPLAADSKKIYSSGRGLRGLEQRVHRLWQACLGPVPASVNLLIETLTGTSCSSVFEGVPWFTEPAILLPAAGGDILPPPELGLAASFIRSTICTAPCFNRAIRSGQNKGDLMFGIVCGLVRAVMERFPGERMTITVDRLGGRKFYAPFLREQFPEWNVTCGPESAEASSYRLTRAGAAVTISFAVKADAHDCLVGISSMISKYVRELCMLLFNRWFQAAVPGLRPTAGYPEDARRFLDDIAGAVVPEVIDAVTRIR